MMYCVCVCILLFQILKYLQYSVVKIVIPLTIYLIQKRVENGLSWCNRTELHCKWKPRGNLNHKGVETFD
jgi:hypothetical protein